MNWRIAPAVAWVDDLQAAAIYIMKLPAQRPVVLSGSAAMVWQSVAAGTDPVTTAAEAYQIESATIQDQVDTLLAELADHQLIERAGDEA